MIELGEMTVFGRPESKLLKALAAISATLHPAFDESPRIVVGKSRESCVLCSLAVWEFLTRLDFKARVRPVTVLIKGYERSVELHSLGIGVPGDKEEPGRWVGHMVCEVDSGDDRYLVDTTLYPAIRPVWPFLPPMVVVPRLKDTVIERYWDRETIAALSLDEGSRNVSALWIDDPRNNGWRSGPDARDKARRHHVVNSLVERFGVWKS